MIESQITFNSNSFFQTGFRLSYDGAIKQAEIKGGDIHLAIFPDTFHAD